MKPYELARAVFGQYAGTRASEVEGEPRDLSSLQARLSAWQARNFHNSRLDDSTSCALGINEEFGEAFDAFAALAIAAGKLNHVTLKARQRIRGYEQEEKVRAELADAIADMQIFAMQLCTVYRLDYATLLCATAEEVMQRDFIKFPKNGRTE